MPTVASKPRTPQRVLVIDDEENMRHMLGAMLQKAGYGVDTAADGQQGLAKNSANAYDYILCDIKMPRMDGMAFLKAVQQQQDAPTVVMMSAFGTVDIALEAIKLGAYDYVAKPFKADEVILTLKKAEERQRLKTENDHLKRRIRKIESDHRFYNMVGKSAAMQAVFRLTAKVAQYDTTVLITGESGTGKELIAKGIHFNSNRAQKPLISINCGGIPESLLESELFGHTKGAFTGADRDKPGLFQEAEGGSIFLDEIGEMPLSLQVKLLRVLQESEVRPVGSAKIDKIDVRVIAATAKDLEAAARQRTFREDLFYRLNVVNVKLPPLRDRLEDIPLLVNTFIADCNQKMGRAIKSISPEAMARLLGHHWPGNVRELENVIERTAVLTDTDRIMPEHLPSGMGGGCLTTGDTDGGEGFSLKIAQKSLEQKMIRKALEATGGNRSQAARLLEISHPSLLSKIKTYQIDL